MNAKTSRCFDSVSLVTGKETLILAVLKACLGYLWGPGLTWRDLSKNRPAVKQAEGSSKITQYSKYEGVCNCAVKDEIKCFSDCYMLYVFMQHVIFLTSVTVMTRM